jgi:hypothetical protein
VQQIEGMGMCPRAIQPVDARFCNSTALHQFGSQGIIHLAFLTRKAQFDRLHLRRPKQQLLPGKAEVRGIVKKFFRSLAGYPSMQHNHCG